MKRKQNKYLDRGMTNLILLVCLVYAFITCYACFLVLNDSVDFGVVASTKSEVVWRVSE